MERRVTDLPDNVSWTRVRHPDYGVVYQFGEQTPEQKTEWFKDLKLSDERNLRRVDEHLPSGLRRELLVHHASAPRPSLYLRVPDRSTLIRYTIIPNRKLSPQQRLEHQGKYPANLLFFDGIAIWEQENGRDLIAAKYTSGKLDNVEIAFDITGTSISELIGDMEGLPLRHKIRELYSYYKSKGKLTFNPELSIIMDSEELDQVIKGSEQYEETIFEDKIGAWDKEDARLFQKALVGYVFGESIKVCEEINTPEEQEDLVDFVAQLAKSAALSVNNNYHLMSSQQKMNEIKRIVAEISDLLLAENQRLLKDNMPYTMEFDLADFSESQEAEVKSGMLFPDSPKKVGQLRLGEEFIYGDDVIKISTGENGQLKIVTSKVTKGRERTILLTESFDGELFHDLITRHDLADSLQAIRLMNNKVS